MLTSDVDHMRMNEASPCSSGSPQLPKTLTHLYTIHPEPSLLGTKKPRMSSNPSRPNSLVLISLFSSPSVKTRGQPAKLGLISKRLLSPPGAQLRRVGGPALRTLGYLQSELLSSGSSAHVRTGTASRVPFKFPMSSVWCSEPLGRHFFPNV